MQVATFRDVAAALQAPAASASGATLPGMGGLTADADVVRELERHRERFLEGMEEAHGKVRSTQPIVGVLGFRVRVKTRVIAIHCKHNGRRSWF